MRASIPHSPDGDTSLSVQVSSSEIRTVIRATVLEVLAQLDWPVGRLSLTEVEAAEALGVGRHVLRDLRLSGELRFSKIGKRVVYTRSQLSDLLVGSELASARAPNPRGGR